jgi:hypothetical protein
MPLNLFGSIAGTVAFTSIVGQDSKAPILAMLLCVVQHGHDSIAHGVPIFTAAQAVTPALIVNSQDSARYRRSSLKMKRLSLTSLRSRFATPWYASSTLVPGRIIRNSSPRSK